jgi:uncharacterized membrane protein
VSGTPSIARGLRVLRIITIVVLVAGYPYLVLHGLDHASARTIGGVILAVVVVATAAAHDGASRLLPLLVRRFGLLVVVSAAAAATNHPLALTMLPTLTSLWLLASFGATLVRGPSMVGRFAVAMHDGFPDFLLPYCRKVTWMWCVFFALNAALGAVLALDAPAAVWAFYTGVVSYVAVGALAAGEYAFHKMRFRFYEDGWLDRIWRRLLPPQRSQLGRRTLEWQLEHQPRNAAAASTQ